MVTLCGACIVEGEVVTLAAESADVVVIGAGVVGASVAYELSKRGASVIVVDTGEHEGYGCSYANAGLLAPSHVEPLATPSNVAAGLRYMFKPASPFYVHPAPRLIPWLARFVASAGPRRAQALTARMREMATRSLRLHSEYAGAGLLTGFRQSGSLDVFLTGKQFERAARALRTQPSGPSGPTILSADEARVLEPSLGEVTGAIYRPTEAQCATLEFVRATLAAAERSGTEIHWGRRVQRLLLSGGRISAVETVDGKLTADNYVIAAGLGSAGLCESIGIKQPMEGAKGYVVDLSVADSGPRLPLTFKELKVVATPYSDRLRLCGTLELGGRPQAINKQRVQAIQDAGKRGLPRLDVQGTLQTWAGRRPCTPDGVPSIGRSRIRDNLIVATGHGMWGLTLAPVTGELIATGVLEGAPTLHEPAFSPDRFGTSHHYKRQSNTFVTNDAAFAHVRASSQEESK